MSDRTTGLFAECWHDYDSFTRNVNWRDFTIVQIGGEWNEMTGRVELDLALLGLHARVTYVYDNSFFDGIKERREGFLATCCDNCNAPAPRKDDGTPLYPTSHGSSVGLCQEWCAGGDQSMSEKTVAAFTAESDACDRRGGTSASHCDHETSPAVHPLIPHTKTFRCCFCGRVRSEKYEPPRGGQAYGYNKRDHGPFAPKVWVMN